MNLANDGLVLVVKRDCPTCRLIAPLAGELTAQGALAQVISQDDPAFPEGLEVTDDRSLEGSWRLGVEIVPTLVRRERGAETARIIGWHRGEWRAMTGIVDLQKRTPRARVCKCQPGRVTDSFSRR